MYFTNNTNYDLCKGGKKVIIISSHVRMYAVGRNCAVKLLSKFLARPSGAFPHHVALFIGQSPASFSLFSFFLTKIVDLSQHDSNPYRLSRRCTRCPLDHHHDPRCGKNSCETWQS